MINRFIILISLSVLIVACGTSESNIQTAIAETQSAEIVSTRLPIQTPSEPTMTPTITLTPKPKVSCQARDVETYLEELDFTLEEWDDTEKRAGTTARMSLSPVIGELQDIRRRVRRLNFPECGEYLNDLVIVAMDRSIDSLFAFLGDEGDNIITQHMITAENTWKIISEELDKFKDAPLKAYEDSIITAVSLTEDLDTLKQFELPDGWENFEIPKSKLVISAPGDWSYSQFGYDNDFGNFVSKDKHIDMDFLIANADGFTDTASNFGRLFSVKTFAESQDSEYFLEKDAYYDIYNLNKGYTVFFSVRKSSSDQIEDWIYSYIITPDDDTVFFAVCTDRDDFREVDIFLINTIFSSVRYQTAN